MLVGLVPPRIHKEKMLASFEELQSLVRTFGGEVYAATVQNSSRSDPATYVGKGKAQEIADTVALENIAVVVVNANLKPGQLYTLKKIFERGNPDILVWDKLDLILHIFSKHAATAEAKLQIRLAQMRHMGPRIYGMGMILSQQAGGIGTRGLGETNTELMHRHWKQEMRQIRAQLAKIAKTRNQQMNRRKKSGLPTISIVGYTNAGKTSLFNRLSGEKNLVENALFATLDSAVSNVFLPTLRQDVFLSDTIGFLENLPPELLDAFKSTLMETVYADLLLHVIDLSDPWLHEKIVVVEHILTDLAVNTKNQIYVFNKVDRVEKEKIVAIRDAYTLFHPQFISAKTGEGIAQLLQKIQDLLVPKQV